MGTAIRYATSRWPAMTRFVTDGRLEICNNAAERAMRPIALGRHNWTFAGSDAGGERAALMSTLIETAKFNGLDPEAYLRQVIRCIADHPVNRVTELLPWVRPSGFRVVHRDRRTSPGKLSGNHDRRRDGQAARW